MAVLYKYQYTNKRKNIHPWNIIIPNLIIFVFNAGRGTWAQSRILDLDSTSIAGRVQVFEKFLREVIGKSMVPVLCMFSFRRLLRTSEGGGGKGRANRRNGSEQRVAGSADGNSDLLRVTRRKLSCGTFGYGGTFICPCDLDLP